MGEVSALRELAKPPHTQWFLVFWLIGWTIGGCCAILAWLWMAFGKEVVTLGSGQLSVEQRILGVTRKREFDTAHITNLRVVAGLAESAVVGTRTSARSGAIAFDYGSKTFRFGASLDESEASVVVAELRQRQSFRETAG